MTRDEKLILLAHLTGHIHTPLPGYEKALRRLLRRGLLSVKRSTRWGDSTAHNVYQLTPRGAREATRAALTSRQLARPMYRGRYGRGRRAVALDQVSDLYGCWVFDEGL